MRGVGGSGVTGFSGLGCRVCAVLSAILKQIRSELPDIGFRV